MKINERIKELRNNGKYKRKEIADILNVELRSYQNYETGTRKLEPDKIIILAKFYDVSADYLLGTTEIKTHHRNDEK